MKKLSKAISESFVNEAKIDVNKLIKTIEDEMSWNINQPDAITDVTSEKDKWDGMIYDLKSKTSTLLRYTGMKGSSVAKDLREAVKIAGHKAIKITKENGDNEHYYYIEVE